MMLIVNRLTGQIIAQVSDTTNPLPDALTYVEAPEGFSFDTASDWLFDGTSLVFSPGMGLHNAQQAAITRVKAEAGDRLAALDWKLSRAKERELAGWGSLGDVAKVLAQRESIRQSSNAAEAHIATMTDIDAINAFTWKIDVVQSPPRLISQTEFARRFTDVELSTVMEAAKAYAPIAAWLERFRAASAIDLDNLSLQTGVMALEVAGLLPAGRAEEILQ